MTMMNYEKLLTLLNSVLNIVRLQSWHLLVCPSWPNTRTKKDSEASAKVACIIIYNLKYKKQKSWHEGK